MLVLTRKIGQAIYLGDNIKVFVQEVRGGQVRLGIDAPGSIKVFREEIYLQILEESKAALEQSLRHVLPTNPEEALSLFNTKLETTQLKIEGGLIGFSKWEHFEIQKAMNPFMWLQSTQNKELKFLVLPVTNYKKILYTKKNIPSQILCLVTPQNNFLESSINLKAPLVIDDGQAQQMVIDDDEFEVKLTLAELLARVAT